MEHEKSDVTLYAWQEECLKVWRKNRGRGMVQAVTGSGKTLLALWAVKWLNEKYGQELEVKIVVPTRALMRQWQVTLKSHLNNMENCQVYVINSARYRLAREILAELREGKKVFLIADECHRYCSAQNRLIFEFVPYLKSYEEHFYAMGLSATLPVGEDRKYLSSVLGGGIYRYGMKEAQEANTICRYDVFHIGVSFSEEEQAEYQALTEQMQRIYAYFLSKKLIPANCSKKEWFEFLRQMTQNKSDSIAKRAAGYLKLAVCREKLTCLAEARITCALKLIETIGVREKILVFGERIGQAEELYRELYKRYPGRVGRYHSKMGEQANRNTLERFSQGELRILIACKSMDEGVDIPDASVGIVLSGTSVRRQRIQRLGRIVRKSEGKERAMLYYLHLEDSVEEQMFLPDTQELQLFELQYDAQTDHIYHEKYDVLANELLQDMQLAGAKEKEMEEAIRILETGRVRGDWLGEQVDCDRKIAKACTVRERNYWLCMKKIATKVLS